MVTDAESTTAVPARPTNAAELPRDSRGGALLGVGGSAVWRAQFERCAALAGRTVLWADGFDALFATPWPARPLAVVAFCRLPSLKSTLPALANRGCPRLLLTPPLGDTGDSAGLLLRQCKRHRLDCRLLNAQRHDPGLAALVEVLSSLVVGRLRHLAIRRVGTPPHLAPLRQPSTDGNDWYDHDLGQWLADFGLLEAGAHPSLLPPSGAAGYSLSLEIIAQAGTVSYREEEGSDGAREVTLSLTLEGGRQKTLHRRVPSDLPMALALCRGCVSGGRRMDFAFLRR